MDTIMNTIGDLHLGKGLAVAFFLLLFILAANEKGGGDKDDSRKNS